MFDLQIPFYEHVTNGEYLFFEPKPFDKFNDETLEGCLRQFAKIEDLSDKDNLYFCEKCTEDKYGNKKSKK